MNQILTKALWVIGTLIVAILMMCIIVKGGQQIYIGLTDFDKPGGEPIEQIIEGLKTLSVIGVAYLLVIHLFTKKK